MLCITVLSYDNYNYLIITKIIIIFQMRGNIQILSAFVNSIESRPSFY